MDGHGVGGHRGFSAPRLDEPPADQGEQSAAELCNLELRDAQQVLPRFQQHRAEQLRLRHLPLPLGRGGRLDPGRHAVHPAPGPGHERRRQPGRRGGRGRLGQRLPGVSRPEALHQRQPRREEPADLHRAQSGAHRQQVFPGRLVQSRLDHLLPGQHGHRPRERERHPHRRRRPRNPDERRRLHDHLRDRPAHPDGGGRRGCAGPQQHSEGHLRIPALPLRAAEDPVRDAGRLQPRRELLARGHRDVRELLQRRGQAARGGGVDANLRHRCRCPLRNAPRVPHRPGQRRSGHQHRGAEPIPALRGGGRELPRPQHEQQGLR